MKQNNISVESLAADEHFQRFCLLPTDSDHRYWKAWVAQHPQHHETYLEAIDIVRQLSLQPKPEEVLGELEKFRTSISETQKPVIQLNRRRYFLQIAATFLLLITIFGLWKIFGKEDIQLLVHKTTFGETKELTLSDGSTVHLNANSKLRFPEAFTNTNQREIWLDGEAFFDVSHQKNSPFLVHTTQGDVQVLGTSFNVSQRQDDFEVTLVTGKVRLQLPNDTKVNLKPGEQANIVKQTVDIQKIDTQAVAAWRNNQMNFKNVSIQRIITQIENDFGWSIQVNNKDLLKRKINAQIPENNPTLLFEALTAIYDLNIEKIAEGKYLIKKQ